MADKILVSVPEMEATINRYNQAHDTMEQARRSMENALEHLNNCWKGPAWAAMMLKWTTINGNIKNSEMTIERTMEALHRVIDTYRTGEENVMSDASKLESGEKSVINVK